MKISDILQDEFVSTKLPGKSKEEVLNSVIDLLKSSKKIKDLEKVREAIFEREKIMSTGVGLTIAVPHANEEDIPSLTEYLRSNPAWSSTDAARNGRVYISVDNSLLQGGTDIARTIRKVRGASLKN